MTSQDIPILVVTGETSGERHAAGLIAELKKWNPQWNIDGFGSGGTRMREAGVELLIDVSKLSAIGTWEALSQMTNYWKLYRQILAEVGKRRPLLAILVDFPDFNLRLASRLKAMNVPICYFIGPQVWAWRSSRVEQIRRYVDLMLVVFPFEEEYYRSRGIEAHYVGNPSVVSAVPPAQEREEKADQFGVDRQVPIVALLPGSRKREVEQIFPVQLDVARHVAERQGVRFWVIKAPEIDREQLSAVYQQWIDRGNGSLDLEIREEEIGQLLPRATCAVIKSGTSTLEASLLGVPFAMMYRISWPSWFLIRPRVSADTYCLANLIAGKKVVPEFIQLEATGQNIGDHVLELLQSRERRDQVRKDLQLVSSKLGTQDAYEQAASHVGSFLSNMGGLAR